MANGPKITKKTIEAVKAEWDKRAPIFVQTAIDLWFQDDMLEGKKEQFIAQLNSAPARGKWFVMVQAPDNSGLIEEEFTITLAHWEKIQSLVKGWRQVFEGNYINDESIKGRYKKTAGAIKEIYKNPKWVYVAERHRSEVFNEQIVAGDIQGFDGMSGKITAGKLPVWISHMAYSQMYGRKESGGSFVSAYSAPAPKGSLACQYKAQNAAKWRQFTPVAIIQRDRRSDRLDQDQYEYYAWHPAGGAAPATRTDRNGFDHQLWYTPSAGTPDGGPDWQQWYSGFHTSLTWGEMKASAKNQGPGYPKRTIHQAGSNDKWKTDDVIWIEVGGLSAGYSSALGNWNAKTSHANNGFVRAIARNYPHEWEKQLMDHIIKHLVDGGVDPSVTAGAEAPDDLLGEDKDLGPSPEKFIQNPSDLAPVDLQCFLFENIRELTEMRQGMVNSGVDPFKNFSMIKGSGGRPGDLISYLQAGDDAAAKESLLNICPDIYALLTPYMKFYRVDYDGDDKLRPKSEAQIPFPNFIDPNDIDSITEHKWGRFHGAGIKSFSWHLDGVQPAEVENNISANLKVYFQTLQDLFSLNWSGDRAQAGIPNQAGYLDLIIGSGTSFRSKPQKINTAAKKDSGACEVLNEKYKGENFRIKAVVGWSVPSNFETAAAALGMGSDESSLLAHALRESQTALFLQIVSHNLTFNENGSVELSIDYQAALSGILRSPTADLFVGSDVYKLDKENIDEEISKERERMRLQGASEDTDSLTKLLANKKDVVERDKAKKYKKFLSGIYDSGKVYIMPIGKERWKAGLIRHMDPKQRARESVTRISKLSNPASDVERAYGANELNMDGINSLASHQAARSADEEEAEEAMTSESDEERMRRQFAERFLLSASSDFRNDVINIPFIFLGDLVDFILEDLKFLSDGSSFQFYMGETEMLDPLRAYQLKSIGITCPNSSGTTVQEEIENLDPMRHGHLLQQAAGGTLMLTTNIANIPISLKYFQEWFVNTVVRPQKESYPFLRFIKDLCSGLIGKAFGNICFSKKLPTTIKFDTTIFPTEMRDEGSVYSHQLKGNVDNGRQAMRRPLLEDVAAPIPALILYSVESKPLTGTRYEDHDKGIFHYAMGARCGLPKKITFNRVDQPFLREARIARVGALGAEQLRELYTVQLDMIGNTLHKNGQYLYIEPIGIGAFDNINAASTVQNLATRLGFGGYYLITSVGSTVSDAGFDVQVKALQEGIKFGSSGPEDTQARNFMGTSTIYTGDGKPPNIR
tara:strand:+ start:11884 stop:15663 length:3780 start_codon:yes stop_codon:yes gene_type:complete